MGCTGVVEGCPLIAFPGFPATRAPFFFLGEVSTITAMMMRIRAIAPMIAQTKVGREAKKDAFTANAPVLGPI